MPEKNDLNSLQRIVVMQFLERDEAADQGAGLAGLDAGREQKQLAQYLRENRIV